MLGIYSFLPRSYVPGSLPGSSVPPLAYAHLGTDPLTDSMLGSAHQKGPPLVDRTARLLRIV